MATEILIDGIVGDDILHKDVHRALKQSADDVVLKINSPGGAVDEGIAIHNAIKAHRQAGYTVTAEITGLAASMATYIAIAADTVKVAENSMWMIHHPYTLAVGNYQEMTKTANTLQGLSHILANEYAKRTGNTAQALSEMDAETWLYGNEIVTHGYANELLPSVGDVQSKQQAHALATVQFDAMRSKLRELTPIQVNAIAAMLSPTELLTMSAPKQAQAELPMEPEQVTAAPPSESVVTTVEAVTVAQPVESKVDIDAVVSKAVTDALAAERQRVSYIQQRCTQAKQPQLIDRLIDAGADEAQVNKALADQWIALGGNVEIKHNVTTEQTANKLQLAIAAYQQQHGCNEALATAAVLKANPELYEG